jgi:hypothetical protein
VVANEITRFEPLIFYFVPQTSFGTGKTISKTRKDFSLVIISVLSKRVFLKKEKCSGQRDHRICPPPRQISLGSGKQPVRQEMVGISGMFPCFRSSNESDQKKLFYH